MTIITTALNPLIFTTVLKQEREQSESTNISLLKQYLNTLTYLQLSKQNLNLKAIEFLCLLLKENQTIQSLDCSMNAIDAQGANCLAQMLKVNTTLIELNLERNPISAEGAQYLGNALSVNKTLQVLNLKKTQISSTGAHHIAKGLQSNRDSGLKILDLGINGINASIVNIWDFLKSNTSIISLNLQDNPLGEKGIRALIASLREHPIINNLNLSGTQLTEDNIQALIELIYYFRTEGQQATLNISIENNKNISKEKSSLLTNALVEYRQYRAETLDLLMFHLHSSNLSQITSSYLFVDDIVNINSQYQSSNNNVCASVEKRARLSI